MTGTSPMSMPMFTVAWKRIIVTMPMAALLANCCRDWLAIHTPRHSNTVKRITTCRTADESKFLGGHAIDEIRPLLGDVAQLGLRALQKSLAE